MHININQIILVIMFKSIFLNIFFHIQQIIWVVYIKGVNALRNIKHTYCIFKLGVYFVSK